MESRFEYLRILALLLNDTLSRGHVAFNQHVMMHNLAHIIIFVLDTALSSINTTSTYSCTQCTFFLS